MDLAELWTLFADTQFHDYSPLYERIARDVAASDEVLALVQEAPPESHLPNVLLAAVHYLVLGGTEHPLAEVYVGTSDADPGPLFVDFCLQHREAILELLRTRHTNTNEVGRSAVLGPALTAVAERLGAPLGLVDVGCSAGLNLLCDKYFTSYGDAGVTGPADASVRLACEIVGGRPRIEPRLPEISARVGLDRDPVDVGNDDDVRWQLALVWPDTDRLSRTRLALEEARRADIRVVKGDAVDSLSDVVSRVPPDCVPVVMTTWALAYLPVERRPEFESVLERLGNERTLAWVSGESPGVVPSFAGVAAPTDQRGITASVLGLVVFSPAGTERTLLGFVHPHGTWLDWRADQTESTEKV
jgi:hypothetical protein